MMDNASYESVLDIRGPVVTKPIIEKPASPLSHYSLDAVVQVRRSDVEKDSVVVSQHLSSHDSLTFHGFWDKDPESSEDRARYLKIVPSGFLMILIIIIWGILPIYWGSAWMTIQHDHNLKGWIADLDGGEIGQFVTNSFMATNGPPTTMMWSTPCPCQVGSLTQSSEIEHAVADNQAWAIVTINPNASSTLNNSIASLNGTYNGSLAVTIYTNEARNVNAYRIISPEITAIMQSISQGFAAKKAAEISPSTNFSRLLSSAPQTVTDPLGYTIYNTRPFSVQVVNAANFIGMIFMTIIAFIAAMLHHSARVTSTGLNRRLKLSHLVILRLLVPFVGFFVLSVFMALLSFAFKAPFTRWYGGSGFVILWMMTWATMLSLGLALEAMLTILTPRFIPFFLALWVVANVSPSTNPIELYPAIFRYGYAMPFYNFSKTLLTICFNTKNEIGLNFGVQIAWIAVSVCTTIAFESGLRMRAKKAWDRQHEKKEVRYSMDLQEAVRAGGRAI